MIMFTFMFIFKDIDTVTDMDIDMDIPGLGYWKSEQGKVSINIWHNVGFHPLEFDIGV